MTREMRMRPRPREARPRPFTPKVKGLARELLAALEEDESGPAGRHHQEEGPR